MSKAKILVTGSAGFIGFHLTLKLLEMSYEVVGLDNINDYYDPQLKLDRLAKAGIRITDTPSSRGRLIQSDIYPDYKFIRLNLEDKESLEQLFLSEDFDQVCNLAAQAGVRYSVTNPESYISSNIVGFFNILECCRHHGVKSLSFASSSSVYGLNKSLPFSTCQKTDSPLNLYAASKKSNELMAHAYSHLFKLPVTGLRFFTVYGPWGRPDMALSIFTKSILENKPIEVFNYGEMIRDFTYIDDIIDGIVRVTENPPVACTSTEHGFAKVPYMVYNIGSSSPIRLIDFIAEIENRLGKKAEKIMKPIQPIELPETYADITELASDLGYSPLVNITEGIGRFIDWYKSYYLNREF